MLRLGGRMRCWGTQDDQDGMLTRLTMLAVSISAMFEGTAAKNHEKAFIIEVSFAFRAETKAYATFVIFAIPGAAGVAGVAEPDTAIICQIVREAEGAPVGLSVFPCGSAKLPKVGKAEDIPVQISSEACTNLRSTRKEKKKNTHGFQSTCTL